MKKEKGRNNPYNVQGTVCSEKSAAEVRQTHADYTSQLSLSVVPDIAFDAVKGVEGVIHTASPFVLNARDFDTELFQPAIQGITSILKAVQEHNPDIHRVVITSSLTFVLDPSKGLRPGYTYTEADWNPVTAEEAKTSGGVVAYVASKTLCGAGGVEICENNKFVLIKERKDDAVLIETYSGNCNVPDDSDQYMHCVLDTWESSLQDGNGSCFGQDPNWPPLSAVGWHTGAC